MNYIHQSYSESRLLTGSAFSFKPFSFTIKDSTEQVKGLSCRRKDGHTNYFYNEPQEKKRIVIHYTAGHLRSDLNQLSRTDFHVSVAFVIARSGTIFQLFNSNLWSYHLGPGTIGGNKNESKKTIGIELCNYGFLNLKGDELHTAYSTDTQSDVYCKLGDVDQYHKLDQPFRGFTYYSTFTAAQYESLIQLVKYLCKNYNIKTQVLPENLRYQSPDEVVDFDGIVSHINYRKQGKFDIGPAFEWERFSKGITKLEGSMLEGFSTTPSSMDYFASESDVDVAHPLKTSVSHGDEKVYGADGPEAR